jgi:hypothetical protein
MTATRSFSLWTVFATVSALAQVSIGSTAEADRALAMQWHAEPVPFGLGPGTRPGEAGFDARPAAGRPADLAIMPPPDSDITASINAEFASDAYLREQLRERLGTAITVVAVNGNVVLRGAVPNTAARNLASVLARRVNGVVDVTNDLTVQALHH